MSGAPAPRQSPWSADPVSWFTTSSLPLTALVLTLAYAGLMLSLTMIYESLWWVQVLALVLCIAALGALYLSTRPPRRSLPPLAVLGVGALSLASVALSAFGYSMDGGVALELWWAPLGASLTLIATSPYLRPVWILLLGLVHIAATTVIAAAFILPEDATWPALTLIIITVTPVVIGTVAGVAFSQQVTLRLQRWSERPLRVPTVTSIDESELAAAVDQEFSHQLASAVAFLRGVARRGSVDAVDAERSRELAEELRAHLLAEANDTWLQRVVRGHAVTVADPARLADRLSLPQRTALRAMLDALLAHPDSGFVSAQITLREAAGGAVGVALRIHTTLAEGRRVTYLAPYYVSLQSTVSDIRWRNGAALEVEFEAAGESGSDGAPGQTTTGRPSLVQRTPRRADRKPQRPE